MQLRSIFVQNYRSLRSIRMDMAPINLFIGENGVGKSNLYRALQLLRAAARGTFSSEIAGEGGMLSVLWSGPRKSGKTVRITLEAELVDERSAISYRYRIEAGLKPPAAAGFPFEPQVKEESLTVDLTARPVSMMKRKGPATEVRDESGRMTLWPESMLPSETALSLLGDVGRFPEIANLRRVLEGWRFFHGFRSDAGSPLRAPCLAVTAPMLDEDGSNMAAVFATLAHIRGDTVDLDRAVAEAFPGAKLSVPMPDEAARFGLVLPEFPQRTFTPAELSDGQIRFLALSAGLLSYRLPPFLALNEPEASLHPSMLPALAGMIERASVGSQIWIVTHSRELTDAISERCGVRAKTVIRESGATWIEGMRLTGEM